MPHDYFSNKTNSLSSSAAVEKPAHGASPPSLKKRNVLGRGLQSLFASSSEGGEKGFFPSHRPFVLGIEQIKANPHQPRKIFDKESLKELATSIRQNGLIQPVVVKKSGTWYEIVAGERRWRAAARAGLHKIPVYLIKENLDLNTLALVENIHRENLNPMELAQAFHKLMKTKGWTQAELSRAVVVPRASVANYLRLLNLDPQVQLLVREGRLSMALAKLLLKEEDLGIQLKWARFFVLKNTSVKTAARLLSRNKSSVQKSPSLSFDKNQVLARVQDRYNTSVKLRFRKKGGEISLCFYSEEHLKNLIKNLLHS